MDRQFAEALARDRDELDRGGGGALVRSRHRGKDMRSMMDQAKVLLAELAECVSARGKPYLRGWAGASNLVAFRGEPDEQGRPTWKLYLVERQARDGSATAASRAPSGPAAAAGAPRAPSARYRAPPRESARARQERVAGEVAAEYGAEGEPAFNDPIPF